MLFASAPASAATTWHVTDAGDTTGTTCTAVPAQCTLRDAVNDAVDGDTIVIDPGIDPALSTTGIGTSKSLTIQGQGAAATTVSVGSDLIFTFSNVASTVRIEDLELTGGSPAIAPPENGGAPGGAIFNIANLTLERVLIQNNHAQDGGPGLAGSSGSGGIGGAIYTSGDLTIVDSTIRSNSAGDGGTGGVFNGGNGGSGGGIVVADGTTTISRSTLDSNSSGLGGATANALPGLGGDGGAIAVVGAADGAAITNSTIYNNTTGPGGFGSTVQGGAGGSGAGIDVAAGAVVLTNTTIANNLAGAGGASGSAGQGPNGDGGGVIGTMVLRNSLLSNNSPTNCGVGAADGLHNIGFGDPSCPAGFAAGNPVLGAFQNNGGPTDTLALGAGSAALDQVPATGANCPATDQRGVTRPQGTACDIGAFELAVPPVVTPTPSPTPAPVAKKKCKKGFKLVKKHGKKKCKKKKKK
jgi:hypothetical protein